MSKYPFSKRVEGFKHKDFFKIFACAQVHIQTEVNYSSGTLKLNYNITYSVWPLFCLVDMRNFLRDCYSKNSLRPLKELTPVTPGIQKRINCLILALHF